MQFVPENIRQLVITLIIVVLMDYTDGQYPDCVSCADGSVPLSPLSYNTMRSHVFNGTQPSNEGCTNGVSIDGQVTIDCGQGTTLIDCNRGFNGGDYSDLSNTFAWNRTTSLNNQVSIVFTFYQQINISMISMFFWNSQSNSIIIPNVIIYWSNDDSITPSNEIDITTNSPDRTGDGRRRLNINIDNDGLQFQYLRIEMSFYDNREWIFLGEVLFCGNTAPYHITQPSTDYDVQIVSSTATMANLICSLNVTIPSSMIVAWLHNGSDATVTSPTQTGNTAALLIENFQPSDAGIYQCVFDYKEWILRRNIRLIIADLQIIHPPVDHTVTFYESTSSVQLMCSLNIDIPSSVMVIWTHNGISVRTTPPNEVTQTGNTTTLLIGDPQPSDAGGYTCSFTFNGLVLRRFISLVYTNISTTVITTTTTSTTSTTVITATTTSTTDTSTVNINNPATVATTTIITTTMTLAATETYSSATAITVATNSVSSDDNNSSSVGVIVAIVILVVVVFINITVAVVGIVVVWRRRKSEQDTKPEGVYYSTIDETLQKSPANKPEPVYSEMNDNKESQYMDITEGIHSTEQADKVTVQDNPAYSIPSEHQVNMQDNPAYSIPSGTKQ